MDLFKFKITKPFVYFSAIAGTFGAACLIKDTLGGASYRKDIEIEGKVVIITGANTGLGKEVAREMAWRKAKVYMACRNLVRCEEARKEIVLATKNKYVYCRQCDLASLDSVRNFVKTFKAEQNELHILVNNAGVMRTPSGSLTKDGFEMQLGVNHLGHFLLTNLLLDVLKASAPSRIVNVASIAHIRGKINKEDLNSSKNYDPSEAYAQSKLANVLFTKALAKKLEGTGVTVNAVHPGIVDTELIRHMSFFNSWLATIFVKPFIWPFVKNPKQGAQGILYVALDPKLEKVSGRYFNSYEETDVSPAAEDDSLASWLWAVSERWTRLAQKEETQ